MDKRCLSPLMPNAFLVSIDSISYNCNKRGKIVYIARINLMPKLLLFYLCVFIFFSNAVFARRAKDEVWLPVQGLTGVVLMNQETGRIKFASNVPSVNLNFTLWAVRHGETKGNLTKGMFQGAVDENINQLTEIGIEQAKAAAELLFSQLKHRIESGEEIIVITSEFGRVRETAEAFIGLVKEETGITIKSVIEPLCNEISFGSWDNKTADEISPNERDLVLRYRQGLDATVHPEGGESFIDLLYRANELLSGFSGQYADKTVVLFNHGTMLSAIRVFLGDETLLDESGQIDWRENMLLNAQPELLSTEYNSRNEIVLRELFLKDEISAEEFVQGVMRLLDRSELSVSEDIAQPDEEYIIGGMLLKGFPVLKEIRDEKDIKLLKDATDDEQIRFKFTDAIRTFLDMPEIINWSSYQMLEVTLTIVRIAVLGDADIEKKEESRESAFFIWNEVLSIVEEAEDPLEAAFRIAVIGNSMDRADSERSKEMEENESYLEDLLDREIQEQDFWEHNDIAILKDKISQGNKNIVYVFDNAGEDVLDFILIHELLKQGCTLTLVGKSYPAHNDATESDLINLINDERIYALIGQYREKIDIIGYGGITQGTDLMRVSEDFQKAWNEADIVIFKGQGNYFTVRDYNPTKNCFFALRVKWEPEVGGRYAKESNVLEYVAAE